MKINFEKIFEDLEQTIRNNQRRVEGKYPLKVYYGINSEGMYRLAFLSSIEPPRIESTKLLKMVQGRESSSVYWTCFDLVTDNAKKVFYSFCSDLIGCIKDVNNEREALLKLKDRFHIWRNMFRKSGSNLTDEKTKGLFGELYFLHSYLIPKYGYDKSINSWSGPENTSKDFSTDSNWFEVKTISSTQYSVKISSISQLSSALEGHLVVYKIEKMSEEFNNGMSSIEQLISAIFEQIESEEVRERFISKLEDYGYSTEDEATKLKFEVKQAYNYYVNDKFPRLLETDIKYQEISKLTYELFLNTLEKFKGDLF